MAKCKCCGRTIWCGVLLHSECYEQLRPVWHSPEEKPPQHIDAMMIDDVEEPFSGSVRGVVRVCGADAADWSVNHDRAG